MVGCRCEDYVADGSPVLVKRTASVLDVIEQLRAERAHYVLITDDERRIVGIFTERDLVTRVLASGRSPADVEVGDVMTADVEVLGVDDDVAYAINKMAEGGFRNVPVVDGTGRVCGAVDIATVTSKLAEVLSDDDESRAADSEWLDIGGGD